MRTAIPVAEWKNASLGSSTGIIEENTKIRKTHRIHTLSHSRILPLVRLRELRSFGAPSPGLLFTFESGLWSCE